MKISDGHRIREYRKKRGLTLKQLAPRLGMTASELSKVERGEAGQEKIIRNVTVEHLRRAAPALDCSAVELLPRDLVPPNVLEIAARFNRLSPEDQAVLRRVVEALSHRRA